MTNKYLSDALAGLPGHRQALDLAAAAEQMLTDLQPPAPVAPELSPLEVGTITAEWLDAVDAHSAALAQLQRRRGVLLEVRRHATSRAAGTIAQNINTLLTRLNSDLTQLLDEAAQTVEQLGDATTAEEVVENDCAPAWKQPQR